MKSSLNIEDFKNKLTELTNVGEPILNGTPLAVLTSFKSPKSIFFGKFDDKCFRLTSNGLSKITTYIIKGSFEQRGNETEVNYKIISIWFGYLWIRIFPIVTILYFHLIVFKSMSRVEKLIFYFPINLFLIMILITSIVQEKSRKSKLEKLFTENFYIK
jgi:hypothetical protein